MKFCLPNKNSGPKNKGRLKQAMVLAVLCTMAQAVPFQTHAASLATAKTKKHQLQTITVNGKVVDEKGDAIPGVTVLEKGTANGSVTDLNGAFRLNVAGAASVLVIRFIGYDDKEVIVGTQTVISITLTDNVKSLNEVVVVGYGTQKKA